MNTKRKVLVLSLVTLFILALILVSSADSQIVNLYIRSEADTTGYVKGGKTVSSTQNYSTGFISVESGKNIAAGRSSLTYTSTVPLAECYDSQKEFVKDIFVSDTEATKIVGNICVINYTVPEGIAYMKFNFKKEDADKFVVSAKDHMSGEELYEYLGEKMPVVDTTTDIFGKSVLFLGDSLCNGSTDKDKDKYPQWGYAGRFQYFDEMKVTKTGTDGNAFADQSGYSKTEKPSGRIINQITAQSKNKFDYVILEGGVNDGWFSSNIGKMSDSFDKKDFDNTTFAGAFEYAIATIRELYPDAKLGFFMYFRLNLDKGFLLNMTELWTEAKKICEKWDVPMLDLYFDKDTCTKYGIPYRTDDASKAEITKCNLDISRITVDGCHPNGKGYDRLYNALRDFMISLTAKEEEPPVETLTTASDTTTPAETDTPVTEKTAAPETSVLPAPTGKETETQNEDKKTSALPFILAGVAALALAGGVTAFILKKKKA